MELRTDEKNRGLQIEFGHMITEKHGNRFWSSTARNDVNHSMEENNVPSAERGLNLISLHEAIESQLKVYRDSINARIAQDFFVEQTLLTE